MSGAMTLKNKILNGPPITTPTVPVKNIISALGPNFFTSPKSMLNVNKINASAERACEEVSNVSASEIVLDAQLQLFDKITSTEIDQALILSAREKIEKEPNYSYAAARLLLNTLYKEVFKESADSDAFKLQYRKSFIQNIKKLVKENRVDSKLLDFDLPFLSEALKIRRDKKLKYLGVQILYDRYFIRLENKVRESPQSFYMRVAMGLALNEENKNEINEDDIQKMREGAEEIGTK